MDFEKCTRVSVVSKISTRHAKASYPSPSSLQSDAAQIKISEDAESDAIVLMISVEQTVSMPPHEDVAFEIAFDAPAKSVMAELMESAHADFVPLGQSSVAYVMNFAAEVIDAIPAVMSTAQAPGSAAPFTGAGTGPSPGLKPLPPPSAPQQARRSPASDGQQLPARPATAH